MEFCKRCYKRHWIAKINKNTGLQVTDKQGDLVYICVNCEEEQSETNPFRPISEHIAANVLYVDIEKSKSLYYNYGPQVRSKRLNIADLAKEPFMISWAASYVDNPRIWSQIVTPEQAIAWDDSQIVRRLHGLMQAAEIIAGHNIDGFDIKNCNTFFRRHGLEPIWGKKTIDTLKLARKHYAWESNTLGYVCQALGIDGKDKITNDDWLAVIKEGDSKILRKVLKYNRHDVERGKAALLDMSPLINKKANYGSLKVNPVKIEDWLEDIKDEVTA